MKTDRLERANPDAGTGAATPLLGGNAMVNTIPQTGSAPVNGPQIDHATHMNAVVATRYGAVRGSVTDGIHTFKGIPYAAPPFGAFRSASAKLSKSVLRK